MTHPSGPLTGTPNHQDGHRRVVHDEPGHMTQAPRPRLRRTGSRPSAEDQHVRRETLGSGNDFLLRAASPDQVRNLGLGQSRREPLVPHFQ